MAPIILGETSKKILADIKGEKGEAKLFEDKEERFVTYKGARIPQNLKIKAFKSWFFSNKKYGINPYALCIKKTGWSFLATCIADSIFAEEELGGKKRYDGAGVFVFELPELMTLSFIQRKIIKWRNEKDIVAESSNVFAFKEDGAIKVRVSYVSDFVLSMLKDFSYDRKTNYWTGSRPEKIKKLAITDNLPDTKTYGKGLYYLCETEEKKILKPDLSACFRSLFSL